MLPGKNAVERVFLISVIQATDSTITGWNRKNCGGKPGCGQAKFAQSEREKNGIQSVEQDVGVISDRIQSPQLILNPKDGAGDRIILLERKRVEPQLI